MISLYGSIFGSDNHHGHHVTQFFGERPEVYSKLGLLGHNGIDYRTRGKRLVYSVSDGICTVRRRQTGYGYHVKVENDEGDCIYAHLSSIRVVQGQEVRPGEVIGFSGGDVGSKGAGFSNGPHLHFEVRPKGVPRGNGYNGATDPLDPNSKYIAWINSPHPKIHKTESPRYGIPLDVPDWAINGYKFVNKKNVSNGSNPNSHTTRAEVWTMLHRLYEHMKNEQ